MASLQEACDALECVLADPDLFQQVVGTLFNRLDIDHNGFLSLPELDIFFSNLCSPVGESVRLWGIPTPARLFHTSCLPACVNMPARILLTLRHLHRHLPACQHPSSSCTACLPACLPAFMHTELASALPGLQMLLMGLQVSMTGM